LKNKKKTRREYNPKNFCKVNQQVQKAPTKSAEFTHVPGPFKNVRTSVKLMTRHKSPTKRDGPSQKPWGVSPPKTPEKKAREPPRPPQNKTQPPKEEPQL